MALFESGFTRCALCGEVLVEGDDIVATTHFIGDPAHPFHRYSDALMHRTCFLMWEHRAAFVAAYNAEMGRNHMRADGTIRDRFLDRLLNAIMLKITSVEAWIRRRPD